MRKIVLLFTLLFLVSSPTFSQLKGVDFDIYPEQKKSSKEEIKGVVGHDESGYYVLKAKNAGFRLLIVPIGVKQKLSLEYYDKNMHLKSVIPIKGVFRKTGLNVKKSLEFFSQDKENNLYMFYSRVADGKTILYKTKMNKSDLTFPEGEIVSQLKNVRKGGKQGSYRMLSSKSGKQRAVVSLSEAEDKNQTLIGIDYLDENFNRISGLDEILPFELEYFGLKTERYDNEKGNRNISDMVLTNTGEIVALAQINVSTSIFTNRFDYQIVTLSENQKNPHFKKLNIPNKYLMSATLAEMSESNSLVQCYGFYNSNPKGGHTLDGSFSKIINPEKNQIEDEQTHEFSAEDLEDFLIAEGSLSKSDKKIKKRLDKGKDARNMQYQLRDINYFNDGSHTVMAEMAFTYTQEFTNANGGRTITRYWVSGDMVFLHYDKKGKLEWIRSIDKDQITSGSGGYTSIGSFHFQKGNLIYVLYRSGDDPVKLSSIDKNGNVKTKTVAEYGRKTKLGKYFLHSSACELTNDNEVVGFCFRKTTKYKAVRLKL